MIVAPERNAPDSNAPDSNAPDSNAPDSNAPDSNVLLDSNEPSYHTSQAFHIVSAADYLASQASGPWVESTSALHPCHECHWKTNHGGRLDRPLALGKPRTLAELTAVLKPLRVLKLSGKTGIATAVKAKMQEMGINKLFYALDPEYIPYADAVRDAPGDIMHLFLCGFTKKEMAWLIDIFVKARYFTWDQLNARVKLIALPHGKRISKLMAQTKQKKRRDLCLDLTASETMYFAKASVVILEALIPAAARELPCWLSWLKHREYLMMCLQHEFKRTDAEVLDTKAVAFLTAFVQVRILPSYCTVTLTYLLLMVFL